MDWWYFRALEADSLRPDHTEVTTSFDRVVAACTAAIAAGEIFRVRPPIGAVEPMAKLARLGPIERI